MELFDKILNINSVNKEDVIKECIKITNDKLNGLTKERMCKVYSNYIYNELKNKNVLSKIINTKDLGYKYEHEFVIVPINYNDKTNYLIDLTYSQFLNNNEAFNDLLNNGYQFVNEEDLKNYLKTSLRENNDINFTNKII